MAQGHILKILSLTLLCFAMWATPLPPNPPGHDASQLSLVRLIFNSRLTIQDPERSMSCFSTYSDASTSISDIYNSAYKDCLKVSADARTLVEKKLKPQITALYNASNDIIKHLKHCNEFVSSIDIVNCHVKFGSNNTQSSYTISANSSQLVSKMQESNRLIAISEEQCTSAAERGYVRNTTLNYDRLQDCLDIQKENGAIKDLRKLITPSDAVYEGPTEGPTLKL